MATTKFEAGSIQTLMTTELNSLANGSGAIASAGYDNGASGNLYMYGLFEINVTFGTNPTAGNLLNLYIIPAPDGTNYDDAPTGASPAVPATHYVGGFPVRAVTSAQKIALGLSGYFGLVMLPPVPFKGYILNNSGQAFPASGSTLKMTPYRLQTA